MIPSTKAVNTQKVATPKELKERWEKKKNQIEILSNNIDRLRRHVAEDLKDKDEKKALTALAIAIIDKTGERVGNKDSADNGNFGVTVLRKKHITLQGDLVTLTYRGKSGVSHETSFSSSKLSDALKKAIKNSTGIRVFQTSDGFRVKNDGVNRYLKTYDISAKDIRGYRSNDWIIKGLSKTDIPKTTEERKKIFLGVLKKVAEKIGHGKATLRNHYMIPEIETSYIDKGKIIDISDKETYEKGGAMKITSDGRKGGLVHGATDKGNGKGVATRIGSTNGTPLIVGGGEIVVNEISAKKHCKELDKINRDGGGRAIDCDNMEGANTGKFSGGGSINKKITVAEFEMPSAKIYSFAKNIKDKYPKIWGLGGNIAGNYSFKKLEAVIKRGYWLESERSFYITWQEWMARHRGDFRIAGVVANLKWLSEVDRGWDYMKDLIDAEIENKYLYGGSIGYFGNKISDDQYKWIVDNKFVYNFCGNNRGLKLKDLISHPELFEKYPEIKNVKVFFKEITEHELYSESETQGYSQVKHGTNYALSTIHTNLFCKYFKKHGNEKYELNGEFPESSKESIILHEIQHLLQQKDGRDYGRSYDEIYLDAHERGKKHGTDIRVIEKIAIANYKLQPSEQEAMKAVYHWLESQGLKYKNDKFINWDYEQGEGLKDSQGDIYRDGGLINETKMESQRFSFKNDFGSFTSVFVFVSPSNKKEFMVQTDVRRMNPDETLSIQKKEKWFPMYLHNDFIEDLKKRAILSGKLENGGNIENKYSVEDFAELIQQLETEAQRAIDNNDSIKLVKLNKLIGRVIDYRNIDNNDYNKVINENMDNGGEIIKGGLADNMPDSVFDKKALLRGMAVEMENTSDERIAKEIAKGHLAEDKNYYYKLAKIERMKDGGKIASPRATLFERPDMENAIYVVNIDAKDRYFQKQENTFYEVIKINDDWKNIGGYEATALHPIYHLGETKDEAIDTLVNKYKRMCCGGTIYNTRLKLAERRKSKFTNIQ